MAAGLSEPLSEYVADALQRVSRTFAAGIAQLAEPLRSQAGVAYLICRVLDTLEDRIEFEGTKRTTLLDRYAKDAAAPETFALWLGDVSALFCAPSQTPVTCGGEDLHFCRNLHALGEAWNELSPDARAIIARSAEIMAGGMAQAVRRRTAPGGLRLDTYEELDRYCYFVAGTVGEMLTELIALARPSIGGASLAILRRHAVAFGEGLQYVNIVKGLRQDSERGAIYLPGADSQPRAASIALSRRALDRLEPAWAYTLAIPAPERDLRFFCVLPVLLALRTLALGATRPDALAADGELKVSRSEVLALIDRVRAALRDDAALSALYRHDRDIARNALANEDNDGFAGRLDRDGAAGNGGQAEVRP